MQGVTSEPAASLSLAEPFHIGCVQIPNGVVLAPMAGLTCSAYRRHMRSHGAGLLVSEMVSAQGLLHKNRRTAEYLDFQEHERPFAVQLFGESPEAMRAAAELVLSGTRTPDLLDINMGCPVRKVVKTGAGCALMGDSARACAVAAAVVAVASQRQVGVTVKLRSGLRRGDGLALELAPRLEAEGVAAIGVHPRAASEYYKGRADHSVTAEVNEAVGVPVMASGDINSVDAAAEVIQKTGAAAVMVARGAVGDPWLIGGLLAGVSVPRPPLSEVVGDLRRLLALAAEEQGQERAARWIRKLLTAYLRPSRVDSGQIEPLRAMTTAAEVDAGLQLLLDDIGST